MRGLLNSSPKLHAKALSLYNVCVCAHYEKRLNTLDIHWANPGSARILSHSDMVSQHQLEITTSITMIDKLLTL